ncbi:MULTISPECIES: ATP-binding protein [Sphingobacterium]|uniref:ATP-binding protein n=1 Tax=Sphingobacterium populi TaxID=1812824 RepID=A0ABW5U807_9SPHI|nr:ATP-binding protein [Sphingobacterium sp. CFCC 11742]
MIIVPHSLHSYSVFRFINKLSEADTSKDLVIDFSQNTFMDPCSMLVLSSELAFCKKKFYNVHLKNYDHLGYPLHMNFFHSLGLSELSNANAHPNYIPIMIRSCKDIIKDAADRSMLYQEYLTNHFVKQFTEILSNHLNEVSSEITEYCIREMLRNILEHSDSPQLGICAQYFPTKGQIQISIRDIGVGLTDSLKLNPKLKISSPFDAIKYATEPGISGKVYSGMKNKPTGEWVNSGWGIAMTKSICTLGGSFLIASDNLSAYYCTPSIWNDGAPIYTKSNFSGTVISMNIPVRFNEKLKDLLNHFNNNRPIKGLRPSPKSLQL